MIFTPENANAFLVKSIDPTLYFWLSIPSLACLKKLDVLTAKRTRPGVSGSAGTKDSLWCSVEDCGSSSAQSIEINYTGNFNLMMLSNLKQNEISAKKKGTGSLKGL